jgi:hypothetical protein
MGLFFTKSNLARLYALNLVLERYYVWLTINLLILAGAPFQGFEQVSPQYVAGTNPDVIFCISSFAGLAIFSLAAVAYALRRHPNLEIRPPSLMRFPLNWWIDPLQCLFISALGTTLMALGSIPGFIHYGGYLGYWTMAWDTSMAAGLWVGIVLVHLIYRKRLTSSKGPPR